MIQEIAERRAELSELCRRLHVRRLALFGSALRDDFDPANSDLDFIVEFEESAANYFELLEGLSQLFSRNVDLVSWRSARNPYFRRAVENTQETLYAA